ncbi:MAG TPA: 3-hydroxyacyl-CoA dehydrogenase NAD-binding domain-containing protein [Gemmatimonadales bacterium]|jgi:3-hydroxyacyl-CoA dehydrogenase|nr:3-hydroxyacyl-CoA dehydrogenase NAD-binding domain-containing protein [Gemmatimonadales bacterium]
MDEERDRPRVAVIGAGHRGRGWTALALSRGWRVSLYDPESTLLQRAAHDVGDRVRRLTDAGRADPLAAAGALASLHIGRSLLDAVGTADLILDVMPLDLVSRQRLLEQIEQVARQAAITICFTGNMHASQLSSRLRRADRLLVAFALDPVEMSPLVELVPGPRTDPACTLTVQGWLARLGRETVVLLREVPGNATGRILAAVWRECIDLVLQEVVNLADVDRLVSLGPAIEWAAAGPNLSQVMAAGANGISVYLSEQLKRQEVVWGRLARWQSLSHEDHQRLIRLIEREYNEEPGALRAQRDRFLVRLLRAIDQGDPTGTLFEDEDESSYELEQGIEPPEADPRPS